MFNDVTINPSVNTNEDTPLTEAMKKLAKRRNKQDNITNDVQAVFKEGERAPVAGASI